MNALKSTIFSRRVALAMLTSATILAGCGGGGDAGPNELPESITITQLDGPSGGQVGQPVSLNVKVATTGGISASEISYSWQQTAGVPVANQSQGNGNYESTLTYFPAAVGTVTYTVTASARGKTASQSKSVPINP